MFCGPCWSGGPVGRVGPWVWWARGSGGPVGLVGLWVWWARGSDGPMALMGPWLWWILLIAKSPTLRGPTCQGVLGLVVWFVCLLDLILTFAVLPSQQPSLPPFL